MGLRGLGFAMEAWFSVSSRTALYGTGRTIYLESEACTYAPACRSWRFVANTDHKNIGE
jgi:hypothetical protein